MKTARANWLIRRKESGVTLLELLIVVVIVGILAAIAIPSYKKQIVKTNRSNAMADLQGFAQSMERFYVQKSTYAGAAAGTVFPAQSPLDGSARYTLSIQSQDATSYVLRATPVAGGTQVGDGYLEITNTGQRRWDRDNDNSISASEQTLNQ